MALLRIAPSVFIWSLILADAALSAPRPFSDPPGFKESAPAAVLMARQTGGCLPQIKTDGAGHQHYDLRVRWSDPGATSIFNPNADPGLHEPERDSLQLRTYNGCLVGPVIETRPGETLYVDLSNDLDDKDHPTDPTCVNPQHNEANCFNTVNLHFHGYHGSPRSFLRGGSRKELIASDDIFVETAPGERQLYEYVIGRDHPAGTFWYHAHRHGSTAIQVASGMAGPLIVRGTRTAAQKLAGTVPTADIDTLLDRSQFRERILVLQQISYACLDAAGNIVTKEKAGGAANDIRWHCNAAGTEATVGTVQNFENQLNGGPRPWDNSGRYTAINGEVRPPLGVAADVIHEGDIERWRFIHGGIRDAVNVRIVAVDPAAANLSPAMNLRPDLAAKIEGLKAAPLSADALRQLLENLPTGGRPADRDERTAMIKGICNGPVVRQVDIAEDGLTRAAALEKATTYLQPGYRSDVLVAFPKAGLYCVLDETAAGANRPGVDGGDAAATDKALELLTTVTVQPGKPIAAINTASNTRGLFQRFVLDRIVAANGAVPPAEQMRVATNDLSDFAFAVDFASPGQPPPDTPVRTLDYVIKFGGPPKFGWTDTVDHSGFQQHQATVIPFRPVLGSVETWNLSADQTHIHHIHVNPFRILDIRNASGASIFGPGGNCETLRESDTGAKTTDEDAEQYCGLKGAYKDTVFLKGDPAAGGPARYVVAVQTKFEGFTGEFVLHCHILDHEDQGMMANVCVRRPGQDCKPGPHAVPGAGTMDHM